jgi:hypothetical protein
MPDDLLLDGLPFDRRTALDHGIAPERLRWLLRRGLVRHVLHDVYVDTRAPDDLAFRARCLRLRLPDGAALSRLTAAWLFGVDLALLAAPDGPMPVECTVPRGREPVSRAGVRSYAAPLDGDVVVVAGLPCTSPVRTAVDLLRWLPPHEGLAIVDAMAARHVVDASGLPAAVARFAGAPGVAQARYLAAVVEPLTESPGESWLRLRLIDAGFPRPEAQIPVPDADSPGHYRLDLGWRRLRLAVEYDGEEFHDSPRQRLHDERRREDLERRFGWTVLGVGKGEVLGASMLLERTVGGLLGIEPRITRRRW